jgi:hypothetical protein
VVLVLVEPVDPQSRLLCSVGWERVDCFYQRVVHGFSLVLGEVVLLMGFQLVCYPLLLYIRFDFNYLKLKY